MDKANHSRTLETICSRADHPKHDPYGSHVMPLYQTSTFRFENADAGRKFFAHEPGGASHSYSRLGNPTVQQLESVLSEIETFDSEISAESMAFGSGMAAITTALMAIGKGKRILAQEVLYGCTSQFLQEEAGEFNIAVTHIDPYNLNELERTLNDHPDTGLIYLESIANPTMRVCDLPAICHLAKQHNVPVMVDNTFATPYHLRPLAHGADIVAYSTTKYICGHGNIVGGSLTARKGFFERYEIPVYRKNFGGICSPFDAWLTMMGIKTFPLRMKKHNENALKVAEFLDTHPAVGQVWYPGLQHHPDHLLATDLLENGVGGMIAFELKGGYEAGVAMMDSVELCTLAVSLGNVDSLIQHPASMTHSVVKPDVRKRTGITDGLIRLSVGIESPIDLIADLEQALEKAAQPMLVK
ncbi:aminotransferase class I/II-fold pyridoxal phosphate-dependent enzyme [Rhodohalobacter sp. SW132]|uniref:trans-sulfuration enzyme family protein n=1 Tax=Rhodohalobacter sp. SW132 TaxID=2293433 RepID=UPI000E2811DA|nr:aminotransferase class I/II-fold pyridoxal phosphate-dependent enzyme [Rhodohalobacter sp. SW132]REL24044.1 aminotransferase class I/II-fold pyridoxal phosphate-dependent enzyme [Rhodohalobacter sp. SW132]